MMKGDGMTQTIPLRGLAQVNFFADDVAEARDWYSRVLGLQAYFQRPEVGPPAYVEFRIGDMQAELGIVDRRYQPVEAPSVGGVVARWHVDNLRSTVESLISMGASECEPVIEREAEFLTASVTDPFGNILGLIQSPHYVQVFESLLRGEGHE